MSRRTVESHLYRAFPKLAVSSRVELALQYTSEAAADTAQQDGRA